LHIELPPLRARNGDVALLAANFIEMCNARLGQGEKELSASTLSWFERYPWPGNVRELENLIYREYLLTEDSLLDIAAPAELGCERRTQLDRRYGDYLGSKFVDAKTRVIAAFERHYLSSMLALAEGNVTKAANLCGKERRTFGKLLKKHGIDKPGFRE